MRWTVSLWISPTSEEALVVQDVQARCADLAIQKVMKRHQMPFVSCAWVVPLDESKPCVDRRVVRCAAVPLHVGEW